MILSQADKYASDPQRQIDEYVDNHSEKEPDYLKNVVGKRVDYSIDPDNFDKVYTLKNIPSNAIYISDIDYEKIKSINEEKFNMEYECKYQL